MTDQEKENKIIANQLPAARSKKAYLGTDGNPNLRTMIITFTTAACGRRLLLLLLLQPADIVHTRRGVVLNAFFRLVPPVAAIRVGRARDAQCEEITTYRFLFNPDLR
jgi:hypothetical protein